MGPALDFSDAFDRAVALSGPPALFTLDAEGTLRLDADRTRDGWGRSGEDLARDVGHWLLRDRATGWVQYALATGSALVEDHPGAAAARFPTQDVALAALRALGRPPLWREAAWPPPVQSSS